MDICFLTCICFIPWVIIFVVSSNIFFPYSSTHCFPTSFNVMRSSKWQGCASWEHVTCVSWFLLLFYKNMFCVHLPRISLCFAASVPRAHTVEVFPRGPWTVLTFCHLLVNVNNVYVLFIAKSLPPFAASNNFYWDVCCLYT